MLFDSKLNKFHNINKKKLVYHKIRITSKTKLKLENMESRDLGGSTLIYGKLPIIVPISTNDSYRAAGHQFLFVAASIMVIGQLKEKL